MTLQALVQAVLLAHRDGKVETLGDLAAHLRQQHPPQDGAVTVWPFTCPKCAREDVTRMYIVPHANLLAVACMTCEVVTAFDLPLVITPAARSLAS